MALSSEQLSLLFRARGDTDDAKKAFKQLEASVRSSMAAGTKYFDEATLRWRDSTGRFVKGAGKDLEGFRLNLNNLGGGLQSFGSKLQGIGKALTIGLTVPLTLLAKEAVDAASKVDNLKNNLISATGSIGAANQKLADFKKLSAESAGVLTTFAAETYSFLKPMQLGEETIENFTKALGKIKLQAPDLNANDFQINLAQLFSQNFEIADLKQLVGRFPRIGELLAKQYGFNGSDVDTLQAGFQALKKQGKLGIEDFFQGVADSVNNDPSLGLLRDTISIRFAKAFERLQFALVPLGEAIVKIIEPIVDFLVPLIESLGNKFATLSPFIQTVVVAVGAFAAALGPALIVVGGFVAAIGSIISSVVALGGIVVVAKAVGIALAVIAGLFINLLPAIIAIGTAATALYLAWQTNFGGIRDFTFRAFEAIKSAVSAALDFISGVTNTVLAAIKNFWNDNYDDILKTVKTISDAVKTTIQAFLDAVQGFWNTHGERITDYVKAYWDAIRTVISGVMEVIGDVIQVAMALINGDTDKAWNRFVELIKDAAKTAGQIVVGFVAVVGNALKAIIPVLVEYGTKFVSTLIEYSLKAVVGAVVVWATLPSRLIKLVPEMIKAGKSIGEAIIQGIQEAFTANPISIEDFKTQQQQRLTGAFGEGTRGAGGGLTGLPPTAVTTAESEKARKAREKAYQKELDLQAKYNSALLSAERENFEAAQKYAEDRFEAREITQEQFQAESLQNFEVYSNNAKKILADIFEIEKKGKKGTELKTIAFEYAQAVEAVDRDLNDKRAALEKTLTETTKKETDTRLKDLQEAANREIALKDAASKTILARYEAGLAAGLVSEQKFIEARQALTLNLLEFRKQKLEEERAAVKGNADEEARVVQELNLLEYEIQQTRIKNAQETAAFKKKTIEDEKKLALELLELKRDVAAEERRIADFRAEQERKVLANTAEFSRGKARIEALQRLADFDIAEAERRQKVIADELEAEKNAALERIKGKENEEAQKFEIERLYKEKALLSEEEFQQRLKEIKDRFNSEAGDANSQTGFLAGFFGGGQLEAFQNGLTFMENALTSLGNIAGQVFSGIANGIGKMIESYVLLGNAGGQSLRKFAAQVLASVASQAAVLAIFELAKGFAALFFNPGEAAAHFTAAALFGAIAGVAAIAGRAIAGNSFQQQNSQSAFAGNRAASGVSSNATGASETSIINEDRISRGGAGNNTGAAVGAFESHIKLEIVGNDNYTVRVVEDNIRNRGSLHNTVLNLVEG